MPIKSFAKNGYGLYDMAGNVSEWCAESEGSLCGCSWMDIGAAAVSGARPVNYATSSTQTLGGDNNGIMSRENNSKLDYATSSTQSAGGDMDGFWCPEGNGGFRPVSNSMPTIHK